MCACACVLNKGTVLRTERSRVQARCQRHISHETLILAEWPLSHWNTRNSHLLGIKTRQHSGIKCSSVYNAIHSVFHVLLLDTHLTIIFPYINFIWIALFFSWKKSRAGEGYNSSTPVKWSSTWKVYHCHPFVHSKTILRHCCLSDTILGSGRLQVKWTQTKYFIQYNINNLWVQRIVSYEICIAILCKIGTK